MEHPSKVERLVVLEAMPLVERLERADWRFALELVALVVLRSAGKACRERSSTPILTPGTRATPEQMGQEAYADLRRALRDPEVVHAMLEDYRAGLRDDREHDEADRAAGRRITCPLLVVSLLRDDPELDYGVDLAEIWDAWATDVQAQRSTAATTWPRRSRMSSRRSCSTS